VYATVADLRAEGITVAMAADDRLRALVDEAGGVIDRVTGWFFEPRLATFQLDGRGSPSLEPPVPPIRLDRLTIDHHDIALPDAVHIVGAPVGPGFDAPRIALRSWRRFPHGTANVTMEGLWGFTEPDGTAEGHTPREIRRACVLLVLRGIDPLAGSASSDARNRWRILEERTRDQSYRLAGLSGTNPLTGDPEIDGILVRYRRPIGLGAA
jgi:hypothetical protein